MRLTLLIFLLLLSIKGSAADYVGAKACATCHQNETALWQKSDHFHAMQVATLTTVLGDFNSINVSFHGIKTRFFTKNKKYFVETTNKDRKIQTFEVLYTFGHQTLQQYLVETDSGKLQAHNIACDNRPVIDGRQRCF